MKTKLTSALLAATVAAWLPLTAAAQDQGGLITPIDRSLTFIFVPKVIHPWYDVVAQGAAFAAEEMKQRGIEVNVVWDQPPQADVVDQNQRIEANIGRQPDGLAVACLDQATNVQLMKEAVEAGVYVTSFNSFCDDAFQFIGPNSSKQDGYDLGERLAEILGGQGKIAILAGSLIATDHVQRIEGFKEALAQHSLGGALSLALADTRPRLVSTLTLIAPAGLGAEVNGAALTGICNATRPESLAPWLRSLVADERIVTDSYVRLAMAARSDPNLRAAQLAMADVLFPDGVQAVDLRAALERVEMPTRVIWGKQDAIISWRHALRAPGHVGLHLFDRVGHMPQLEMADDVGKIIRSNL